MEKNKLIKIVLTAVLALLLISTGYILVNMYGGEWTCIAKRCDKWNYGDAWIQQNCRPNENKTNLFCSITVENKLYENIPLENIDVSKVKSCADDSYVCEIEVYVKNEGGKK